MRLQRRRVPVQILFVEILGEGGNGGEQSRCEEKCALHAHLAPGPL